MRTTYAPVQFGASPDRRVAKPVLGSTKAIPKDIRGLGQALVDLGEAQTPEQAGKAAGKLTRNGIFLSFRLIGEGIADMARKCFR